MLYYDPLAIEYRNATLIAEIEKTARRYNACLDVFEGRSASLRPLARLTEYDIVVIRAHGGVWFGHGFYLATGLGPRDNPDLPLNVVESLAEQYGLAVGAPAVLFNGSVASSRKYVLVNNLFFERVLRGERHHGVVIVMSCDSLRAKRLINVLSEHGFDVYIGWRGLVAPEDIDAVLPVLFDKVLSAWSRGLRGCLLLRSVLSEMGSSVIARHTGAILSGVCR